MKKTIVLLLLLACTISKLFAQCSIGSLFDNWIATGNARTCIGVKLTYYGPATSGVTWSVDDPTIATVDANGGVTGISAGTTVLSYSDLGGCATQIHYDVITPSDITVSSNSPVCEGATLTLTTNLTHVVSPSFEEFKYYYVDPDNSVIEAGPWPTAISTVTRSIPSVVIPSGGIYTVLIRSQDNSYYSCATTSVAIDPLPTVSAISGATSICAGGTLSLTNTTPSGSWTSSNTSVATINSSGVVYGVISGTTTISYGVTNTCGTTYVTASVPVIGVPTVAGISGATSVCVGADITLAEATPGGAWSSSNNTLATVNSTGVVHGLAAGSPTISYAVTNSCGTTTVTYPITVNPLPNAGVIAIGPRILCRSTPTTFTSSGDAGGSWSISSGTWATINSSTGVVTGVTSSNTLPHTATITYTVTSPHGCGSAYNTLFIRIKGKPALTITPISSLNICTGDIRTLTSSTAGGTFEWSTSANTSIATVSTTVATVTGVSVGTGSTISYAMSDTNYCTSNSFTYNVVARPVLTIGGSTTISTSGGPGCAPNSVVWTVTGGSGGSTYSWTSSGTAVSTVACTTCVGSTSNTITAVGTSSPSETYTVAITAASYCSIPPVASKTIYVVACKPGITEPEIENVESIDKIKVYPNPNAGSFTLEIPTNFDAASITIADITGKIIYAKVTEKDKLDFDLCNFARGMYIISVMAGDKKYREKVLLE